MEFTAEHVFTQGALLHGLSSLQVRISVLNEMYILHRQNSSDLQPEELAQIL